MLRAQTFRARRDQAAADLDDDPLALVLRACLAWRLSYTLDLLPEVGDQVIKPLIRGGGNRQARIAVEATIGLQLSKPFACADHIDLGWHDGERACG